MSEVVVYRSKRNGVVEVAMMVVAVVGVVGAQWLSICSSSSFQDAFLGLKLESSRVANKSHRYLASMPVLDETKHTRAPGYSGASWFDAKKRVEVFLRCGWKSSSASLAHYNW